MTSKTDNKEQFTFNIPGCDAELRVTKFRGKDNLCQPSKFKITVATPDRIANLAALIGKAAVLELRDPEGGIERWVHGIIKHVEERKKGERFATYRLILVPRLDLLKHRKNSRIFQNMSVIDIIKKPLNEHGLFLGDSLKFQLTQNYSLREYCVQYNETDFDFIQRQAGAPTGTMDIGRSTADADTDLKTAPTSTPPMGDPDFDQISAWSMQIKSYLDSQPGAAKKSEITDCHSAITQYKLCVERFSSFCKSALYKELSENFK